MDSPRHLAISANSGLRRCAVPHEGTLVASYHWACSGAEMLRDSNCRTAASSTGASTSAMAALPRASRWIGSMTQRTTGRTQNAGGRFQKFADRSPVVSEEPSRPAGLIPGHASWRQEASGEILVR